MTPEDIVTNFATVIDHFRPITDQPSDTDLIRLQEAVTPLLLQIMYDETGGKHTLISLIWSKNAYVARYGEAFPKPMRVGAYDLEIGDDDMDVLQVRQEAAHKKARGPHHL